jgi:hypothetical protein
MRAIALLFVAVAIGVAATDASATSCVYAPLRFDGGSYDFAGARAIAAVGGPAGTAQYPHDAGGEDDCDVRYEPLTARAIDGVPPGVAVAEEDGSIWVAGGRCLHARSSIPECLQNPLHFRGRQYHPVAMANRSETTASIGRGRLDGRMVRISAYRGIAPAALVEVAGRERFAYLAGGLCRVASADGLASCVRDPRVVALAPLPEPGRDWTGVILGGIGGALVLAGGVAVARFW